MQPVTSLDIESFTSFGDLDMIEFVTSSHDSAI